MASLQEILAAKKAAAQPAASTTAVEPPAAPAKLSLANLVAAQKAEVLADSAIVEKPKEKEEPLGKVIQSFNVATTSQEKVEGELLSGHESSEAVRIIQTTIANLADAEGEDLKHEMQRLQRMLLDNPSACHYLLDEDLGLTVRALRRMTNNRVAKDLGAAKPRGGKKVENKKDIYDKPLDAETLAAGLADL